MARQLRGQSYALLSGFAVYLSLGLHAGEVNAAPADDADRLLFASDIHTGTSTLQTILTEHSSVEFVGLVGDYNYRDPSGGDSNTDQDDVTDIVKDLLEPAVGTQYVLAEGNHESGLGLDYTQPEGPVSGDSDPVPLASDLTSSTYLTGNDYYDIYHIDYANFANYADLSSTQYTALANYLENHTNGKAILIMGHYPLHTTRKSAYNDAATAIFELLNSWGCMRDIMYLWGHNHTCGYDGAELVAVPGDTIGASSVSCGSSGTVDPNTIPNETELNFAYVNAGYVNYDGSHTEIAIDSDEVYIYRHSLEHDEGTYSTVTAVTTQYARNSYLLTVLDNTGSMGYDGLEKYKTAVTAAKARINAGTARCHALWLLQGANSDTDAPTVAFSNDISATSSIMTTLQAIYDGGEPEDVNTPLVDVLCKAMDYLENQIGGSNLNLHFITDGGENASGDYYTSVCSSSIHSSTGGHVTNNYVFGADARTYWDESASSPYSIEDNEDRAWVTTGWWVEPTYGRAYAKSTAEAATLYDWGAGVQLASWEWNMYYRVTRGYDVACTTSGEVACTSWAYGGYGDEYGNYGAENPITWTEANNSTDIIVDITNFYTDVDNLTLTLTGATGNDAPLSEKEGSLLLTSTSTADLENSTYSGLAELTGGKFVAVVAGEAAPILGDLDSDGDVDETDLRIVLAWFGRAVDVYNQPSIDSDLNGDGFINNADIAIVRANWTDTTRVAPIPGDIDYNWCVDSADLAQVMQWYGQSVSTDAQHSYHADMNASGFIDSADVKIVNAHMDEGCDTGGYVTQTGSSGSSSGTTPCEGFCSDPVSITSANYSSGNLGSSAGCYEVTAALSSGSCGNFASGRSLYVNGTAMTCNYQNWTLPEAVNGGYCIEVTEGGYDWAYFVTW